MSENVEAVLSNKLDELENMVREYNGIFGEVYDDEMYDEMDIKEIDLDSISFACDVIFSISESLELYNVCGKAEVIKRKAIKKEDEESKKWKEYQRGLEEDYNEYQKQRWKEADLSKKQREVLVTIYSSNETGSEWYECTGPEKATIYALERRGMVEIGEQQYPTNGLPVKITTRGVDTSVSLLE